MTPDPRTTIVVASRNRRELLLRTAARHLALRERPRVLVVDNASTDGMAAELGEAYPDITVLRLERNAGAAGRNHGVRASDTPYVALTDDDAWWEPGALRRAADLLDRHPRLALIQAQILVGPEERIDPVCVEMAASPVAPADGQPGSPLVSFVACAVVIRREAFLAIGGFKERLEVGGEEELAGWDLVAAGWQLSYMPEVVAHHHPPPPTSGQRAGRREVQVRNALWTAWLRRPLDVAVIETARSLRRLPHDRSVVARGFGRAVTGLPWILCERRVNPPHVEAMLRMLD
jgi:N-acetylglucosaminyl-diphospho-decaprenol L-rhamnosyltransferase